MPFDLPYSTLMAEHGFVPADHHAPQFFPVAARKLYDETGHELDGWKRIVREDTNKTLHVATDAYQIVRNEDAFGAFEDALRESRLDLTGMQVATDYAGEGLRCFRQYLLPAHRVEIKPGNDVALRAILMNSYDGSTKLRGHCGAYSFVCANTSIIGSDYGKFAFGHRSGTVIDIAAAAKVMVAAAEQHVETTQGWKRLPQIAVADEQAIAVFRSMERTTKTLVDHLVHAWVRARNDDGVQGGANAWALYNVLTYWSSHGETKVEGGAGGIKFEREVRVAKVIEGEAWRALVAA